MACSAAVLPTVLGALPHALPQALKANPRKPKTRRKDHQTWSNMLPCALPHAAKSPVRGLASLVDCSHPGRAPARALGIAGILPQCPCVRLVIIYGIKRSKDPTVLPPSPVPGVVVSTLMPARPACSARLCARHSPIAPRLRPQGGLLRFYAVFNLCARCGAPLAASLKQRQRRSISGSEIPHGQRHSISERASKSFSAPAHPKP